MVSARPSHYRKAELTPRQREVLALLASGLTNAEIANRMDISLDGAKYHVSEVIGRLNVDSRDEAAGWWREQNSLSHRFRALFAAPALKLAAAGVAVAVAGVAAIVFLASLRDDTPTQATAVSWGEGVSLSEGLRWVYLSGPPDQRTVLLGSETAPNRQIGTPGRYAHPALSPDGKWLALVEFEGDETFTHVIDTTSAQGVRVQTPFVPRRPDWSPDSQRFVFSTAEGVFVVGTDGKVAGTVVSPGGSWLWDFEWSPDGKHLAAVTEGVIFILDGEGTTVTSASTSGTDDWWHYSVEWEPNSQRFVAINVVALDLFTLGLDGTRVDRPLPDSVPLSSTAWWHGEYVAVSGMTDDFELVDLAWDTSRSGSDWVAPAQSGIDSFCSEWGGEACGEIVEPDEEQARAIAGVSEQARGLWTNVEPPAQGEVALFYRILDSTSSESLSLEAGVFVDGDNFRVIEVPADIPRTAEDLRIGENLQASFVLVE